MAEKVAPHVKKQGAKLIPESMKKSKDGRASNLDGAKLVAASSVQGVHQCNGKFRIKRQVTLSHISYILTLLSYLIIIIS